MKPLKLFSPWLCVITYLFLHVGIAESHFEGVEEDRRGRETQQPLGDLRQTII